MPITRKAVLKASVSVPVGAIAVALIIPLTGCPVAGFKMLQMLSSSAFNIVP